MFLSNGGILEVQRCIFYGNCSIMLKIIKHILLIFTLILPLLTFSQNPALQILNQKEIDVLNQQLQKSLKKCHCFSKKDSVRLFTFFTLFAVDTISKEEYEAGSFLSKLTHQYGYLYNNHPNISEKDSIISAYHFTFSKKRGIMATFSDHDNRFICRIKGAPESYYTKLYTELIKRIWDKENLFVFQMIEKKSGSYFFIVNEQFEISVFYYDSNDENYTMLSIKEFIDRNWEKFDKASSGIFIEGVWTKKKWRSYQKRCK